MLDFQLSLESADAELRAFETFDNLHLFLTDISVDYAMEGTFKDSVIRIKSIIVNFFKSVIEAIYRFFVRIFGKTERLMHKRAVSIIIRALKKWSGELSTIDHNVSNYLHELSKIMLTDQNSSTSVNFDSKYRKVIVNTINEINEECDVVKEEVSAILSSHKGKDEYRLIGKNDFLLLNTFSEECKKIVLKVVFAMESDISSTSERKHALCQQQITEMLNMVSYVERHILTLANDCAWESRVGDNEIKLKNPIMIEIED